MLKILLVLIFSLTALGAGFGDIPVSCQVVFPCMTKAIQTPDGFYRRFGINHYYKKYDFSLSHLSGYIGGFNDENDFYRIVVAVNPHEKSSFLITLYSMETELVVQAPSTLEAAKISPVQVGLFIPRGNQPDYLFKLEFLNSVPENSSEVTYYQQILDGMDDLVPQKFIVKREGISVSCSLPN